MQKRFFLRTCFLLVIFFFPTVFSLRAQWISYVYFNTTIGQGIYADFDDADFVSESEGLYSYSKYSSPSTGIGIWVSSTTDGGQSWRQVRSNHGLFICPYRLYSCRKQKTFYSFEGSCWAYGMYKTSSAGTIWTSVFSGSFLTDVSIIDTTCMYFISADSYMTSPYIFKYVSGVVTKIDSLVGMIPRLIFFPDSVTGYIAASDSGSYKSHQIQKSTSKGIIWTQVFMDTLMNINKMFFTSADLGYVVGDGGKCIKTNDGGSTWQYLNLGIFNHLRDLYFINDSVGFIVGDQGTIVKTEDGGITWDYQYLLGGENVAKVFFVNDSVAFALAGQELFRTSLGSTIGIWENIKSKEQHLNPYPNPSDDEFTLIIPDDLIEEPKLILKVTNPLGQIVKMQEFVLFDEKISLSLKVFDKGVYFISLEGRNSSALTKVLLN